MKSLIPFFALAAVLIVSSISAILYLDEYYISSAILTIIWVVAGAQWIKETAQRIRRAK